MKIKELTNAPQWLLDAKVSNEDVDIIDGNVVWHSGTWEDGIWHSGSWFSGNWHYGFWYGGIWKTGTWEDGTWKTGIWEDGIWEDGTWENGTWEDGTWENGTWENGYKQIGQCKWIVYYNYIKSIVRIGCKEKTVEEWDLWFAGDETYTTARNTEQFKQIAKIYKLAKFAIEQEQNIIKDNKHLIHMFLFLDDNSEQMSKPDVQKISSIIGPSLLTSNFILEEDIEYLRDTEEIDWVTTLNDVLFTCDHFIKLSMYESLIAND